MTRNIFYKWISHFIAFVQTQGGNLCLNNCHLFILDSHKSHVMINVVHKAMGVRINLITLPLHTSHTYNPLMLHVLILSILTPKSMWMCGCWPINGKVL